MGINSLPALKGDATNRGVRSFLTGLAIDVAVAVVLVMMVTFTENNGWSTIEWVVVSFSLAKSVVQAVGAYVLRRWLDPSRLPTPLPPDPQPEPAA